MALFTERVALQEELVYLREMDRENNRRRIQIHDRLRELDREERDGTALIVNPNDVYADMKEIITHLSRFADTPTVEQMLNAYSEETKKLKSLVVEEETTTTTTRKRTEEREETVVKKDRRADLRKCANTVAAVLQEAGRPMKLSEILETLKQEHDFKSGSTPTNALNAMMAYNPRINRISRGYYQYTNV